MATQHEEIRSLQASSWRKLIAAWLEMRKKQVLSMMLDASTYAGLATDTLDENARKQLYTQHLLKLQYNFIDLLLNIPQHILNTEVKETELKPQDVEKLIASFDIDNRL